MTVYPRLADALRRTDWFRRPPSRIGFDGGFKEWMHFCVYGGGLDLLVNFSEVDRPGAQRGTDVRQTVLARDGSHWLGSVEALASDGIRGGAVHADFGDSGVRLDGDRYVLWAQTRSPPTVRVALELVPVTYPVPVYNVIVGDGPPIHWVVVPRLEATGTVDIGDRRWRLHRAPAYHDHNWGHFGWGRDFAWEWGFALPADPENPWSFVFARLNNRALTQTLMQTAFLWHETRPVASFRDRDIRIQHRGLLRPASILKVPPVMALLSPGQATDVPEQVHIEARTAHAHVDAAFDSRAVAQVILPNDDDLGVTIINEVAGSCRVSGHAPQGSFELTCDTVFEFLGA